MNAAQKRKVLERSARCNEALAELGRNYTISDWVNYAARKFSGDHFGASY
jgi:hypothetical protein